MGYPDVSSNQWLNWVFKHQITWIVTSKSLELLLASHLKYLGNQKFNIYFKGYCANPNLIFSTVFFLIPWFGVLFQFSIWKPYIHTNKKHTTQKDVHIFIHTHTHTYTYNYFWMRERQERDLQWWQWERRRGEEGRGARPLWRWEVGEGTVGVWTDCVVQEFAIKVKEKGDARDRVEWEKGRRDRRRRGSINL